MAWNRSDKPNKFGRTENLCWICIKAIKGCSWSESFIPVDGWNAEPDKNSYKIRDCPLYEQNTRKNEKIRDIYRKIEKKQV